MGLRTKDSRRSQSIDWMAILLATAVVTMLSVLSVLRYTGYNTGMFDLGNMSQAIWSVTQGRPLEYTDSDGNLSRLSWHVELIYLAIAGLYALIPDPRTLLVLQALLFGAGAWPAYRLASRHFPNRNHARYLMLFYLLYPTAQTAVLFDFHGDTLAMPLLMFSLEALDRRAWRSYTIWLVLAVLSKLYVAVAVAALGAVIWWKCRSVRHVGTITMTAALVWFLLVISIIRPTFSPPAETDASGVSIATTISLYFDHYFNKDEAEPPANDLLLRFFTAILVLGLALFWGRFAWPWLLPGIVIMGPVLLSSVGQAAAYDYRFHHYAIPVPFFVMATVYGIDKARQRRMMIEGQRVGRPWQKDLGFHFALTVLFFVILVDTPFNPLFWIGPPGQGLHPTRYGQLPRDRFKDQWLATSVPDGAPVAATDLLAPHVSRRSTLYMLRYAGPESEQQALFIEHLDEVNYVVADALYDFAIDLGNGDVRGGVLHNTRALADVMRHPAFSLVNAQDGLLLFAKDANESTSLTQQLILDSGTSLIEPIASFDESVALVDVKVEAVAARRFRLSFMWIPLVSLTERPRLFAVSRVVGADHGRYPHLPTLALHPTHEWQMGELIIEEFEIAVPEAWAPGSYDLVTGWYDSSNLDAAATDDRSRVGNEIQTATLIIN